MTRQFPTCPRQTWKYVHSPSLFLQPSVFSWFDSFFLLFFPLSEQDLLSEKELELREQEGVEQSIRREINALIEEQEILKQDRSFFDIPEGYGGFSGHSSSSAGGYYSLGLEEEAGSSSALGFITGLVPAASFDQFQNLLYRATRGKLFLTEVVSLFL